ncbi:MAG: alanine racemase [Gammaproteobacteria bacterium]|jgi:alanine racemase
MAITMTTMNSHGPNRHPRCVIDLKAIQHNYRTLKAIAGGNQLIAVVKADAYGHGAIEVAQSLPDADAFAVAAVGEGISLRDAGVEQKILIMGGFIRPEELQLCIDRKLDPVVHHSAHREMLQEYMQLDDLEIWIKVDSGMGRLGFSPDVLDQVMETLIDIPSLGHIRMMTHFANADDMSSEFTKQQITVSDSLGYSGYEWGYANSAGILGWSDSHRAWVRSGIALYGANPMSDRDQNRVNLKPAMTMKTSVLAVNSHKEGEVIGYANTYTCPKDMRIAVIACGYADGYPRHKVATAQVSIHGQLCDIVGRVSMDMITVDVTDVDHVQIDDEVILFGVSPDVNQTADCAETISYEILCNAGAHAKREYIK